MEATIKIGGSLLENPAALKALCKDLSLLAKAHRILIVPGGGGFADVVRNFDQAFALSPTIAHKMAILAMDQFGLLLSDITLDSCATYTLRRVKRLSREGVVSILLPSELMFRKDPLEHSWDVTSDSIAAYIAGEVKSKKLILVTDVDGVFTSDPAKDSDAKLIERLQVNDLLKLKERTSVDKFLPKILSRIQVDCYVVNGKHLERIESILDNGEAICTRIVV